ncbi:uncharacterized protein CC84DRAFT_1189984 [Paraphaeosphaeria sporulosa]|uniref:3CxxC-type domain-containing protein n=1 Tax=Paraphaeosphaeria sporulosa TaxID=1460663 RepID=A0A177C1T6_9PLEO|nr:uncharacterized protein CC84DRAFT_1189984 [Paraphaeosphaeria sporulosa]OAG01744.1 hypothetical protein CC84DRAFT_1189984 [Paraphaeosphaeria sporulosa]
MEKPPKFSLHPELHGAVSLHLADDDLHFSFRQDRSDARSTKAWNSNIRGVFICYNNKCPSRSWASGMVAIRILLYAGQQYHAQVYHQRCEQCNFVSKPRLDDSYAERVARRLKIWSGVKVESVPRRGQSKRPHLTELCEGCRAGYCSNA